MRYNLGTKTINGISCHITLIENPTAMLTEIAQQISSIKHRILCCYSMEEINSIEIQDEVIGLFLTRFGKVDWRIDHYIYQLQAEAQYHAFRLQMYTGQELQELHREITERRLS